MAIVQQFDLNFEQLEESEGKSESGVATAAAVELVFVEKLGVVFVSVAGLWSAPELAAELGLGTELVDGSQSVVDSGFEFETGLEPGSVAETEL